MQSAFVVFLAVVLQMHASHGEVQVTQQGCVFQLPSVLCRVLSALSCLQGWSSFGLLPEQERGSDTLHSQDVDVVLRVAAWYSGCCPVVRLVGLVEVWM